MRRFRSAQSHKDVGVTFHMSYWSVYNKHTVTLYTVVQNKFKKACVNSKLHIHEKAIKKPKGVNEDRQ